MTENRENCVLNLKQSILPITFMIELQY